MFVGDWLKQAFKTMESSAISQAAEDSRPKSHQILSTSTSGNPQVIHKAAM